MKTKEFILATVLIFLAYWLITSPRNAYGPITVSTIPTPIDIPYPIIEGDGGQSTDGTIGGDMTVCAADAFACPDGSYVGRHGPKCEFDKCKVVNPSKKVGLNETMVINSVQIAPIEVLEDSRCPLGVVCIEVGTVKISAILSSGSLLQNATLKLGESISFSQMKVSFDGVTPIKSMKDIIKPEDYVFEFSITKETVSVDKEQGTLKGNMSIGPICPVERLDNSCKPTKEMYEARRVVVYKSDKITLVTLITADTDGNFQAVLPVGTYYLDMEKKSFIGSTARLPTTIKISSTETTTLNIDIDTGIR